MSVVTETRAPALFIERRQGDRRLEKDRCANLELDLYHRKRRTSTDRRAPQRSKMEDIAAYYESRLSFIKALIQ